jgi:hypothetical protein
MNLDDWDPEIQNFVPPTLKLGKRPSPEEKEAERLAAAERVSRKRAARKLLRKHGLGDVDVR